jgi:hypothetical protein
VLLERGCTTLVNYAARAVRRQELEPGEAIAAVVVLLSDDGHMAAFRSGR